MGCDFLCEEKLAKTAPELHRIFKDAVFALQNILTSYQSIFPSYTDHSTLHSLQVANFCNRLIGKNIDKMTGAECFVLLMACYLHDTGMGIPKNEFSDYFESLGLSPTENIQEIRANVRSFHNEISSLFVRKYKNFFDFPSDAIATAVAEASRGHRSVNLYDEVNYPAVIHDDKYGDIHIPYIAALIRLADEIDVAADRIPEILVDYDVVALDAKCVREYEKHHAIRHLNITENKFILQVETKDEKLFGEITELKEKIQETVNYCRRVIEERTPFTLTQSDVEIQRNRKRAVIFDTDLGTDDAIAFLLWKYSENGKPDYIVCTPGNATETGVRLSSRILLKMSELESKLVINEKAVKLANPDEKSSFHGGDGFANIAAQVAESIDLPPEKDGDFITVEDMCRELEEYDAITYICVGPLTGIGRVIDNAALREKIDRLYVMGGGFEESNCSHNTEFNFSKHPAGVKKLLESGLPITLFPLDLTNHQFITAEQIDGMAKRGTNQTVISLLKYNLGANSRFNSIDGAVMHDSMPVLYALHPERFSVENRCISCDEYGRTFFTEDGTRVTVAVKVDDKLLLSEIQKLF